MIVDDFSEDLNSTIYETLLKSDPRIRIITHSKIWVFGGLESMDFYILKESM